MVLNTRQRKTCHILWCGVDPNAALPLDQEISYHLFCIRIPIVFIVPSVVWPTVNSLSSSSMPPALTEAIDSSENWPYLIRWSPHHLRGDFVSSRQKKRTYRISWSLRTRIVRNPIEEFFSGVMSVRPSRHSYISKWFIIFRWALLTIYSRCRMQQWTHNEARTSSNFRLLLFQTIP